MGSADTQQRSISNFAQLARHFDESVHELDKQISLVQRCLSQQKNWLLVVDNVEPEVSWQAILSDMVQG
ncbi:hypothetical protein [Candidatus Albibeggiatoa sp. nov. BB20]|uniref:hypothetical protein n=1 Tax=Candidatus Albibeggiatoa sp. nov. BB20 TaxID=3162723 RepID=UPI0033653B7A